MNYRKNKIDYLNDLNEQLDLLIDYCDQLDKGKLHFAKPLATALRVLLQDGSYPSLFTLLEKKDTTKYCSTSKVYSNNEDIIYLVTLVATVQTPIIVNGIIRGSELAFVPMLNTNITHKKWIEFQDWYTSPVFIYSKDSNDGLLKLEKSNESTLIKSRFDIINYFSNKSGGTHISAKVNEDMFTLEKGLSSMAYQDVKDPLSYKPGEKYVPGIPIKSPLHAALRQIGHEVIYTIRKEFNIRKNYNPSHKQICGVKLTKTKDTCVRYNPETRQLQFNN